MEDQNMAYSQENEPEEDVLIPADEENDLIDLPTEESQGDTSRAAMFELLDGEEDIALREECTKHYNLGGGRYQAIVFSDPVHFRESEDAPWQEIDNNLETGVDAQGREVLTNRASSLKVEMAKTAGEGSLVRLTHKGNTLEWTLDHTEPEVIATVKSGTELQQEMLLQEAQARIAISGLTKTAMELQPAALASAMTPQEKRLDRRPVQSEVAYENLAPGLSVKYSLSGTWVKEDIILENREALQYAVLKLPSTYEYEVRDNQGVLVRKDGEEAFEFLPPDVYDSAGNRIDGTVEITRDVNCVRMRYGIDEAFLASALFPVTIDPVAKTSTSSANIEDTSLREEVPNTNYGSNGVLRVGVNNDNNITLFRVKKLVKQRASDTILYAGMRLRTANYGDETEYTAAYPIKHNWMESKATWNKPAVNADNVAISMSISDFIDSKMLDYNTTTLGGCIWDVTNTYRSWYKKKDGKSTNFGIAIRRPVNEGGTYVEFRSVEWNYDKPSFIVNYISHAGLEGWWQYEKQSAGRAGTVNVDLFNGNMVLEHADTTMNGNRMPVSVTHYYNSCLSESDEVHCGMGWRTSAHQSVYKASIGDDSYYVWTDGDGTEHYFKISGDQPYEDSEGMSLKLRVQASTITIEDKGHNRMTFPKPADTEKKYITKVEDALRAQEAQKGSVVSYDFDLANPAKLLKVTDGVGRETVFAYNAAGLLASITAPGCPVVSYTYDDQKRLIRVNYADLTNAQYTTYGYDGTTKMLTSAQNYDGLGIYLAYEPVAEYDAAAIDLFAEQSRRVISMEQKNGSTLGTKLLFGYKDMQTEVTVVETGANDAGKKLTYQFNDSGNVVCVKDELGYAQFTKYGGSAPVNSPEQVSKLQKVVINRLLGIDMMDEKWNYKINGATAVVDRDADKRCLGLAGARIIRTNAGISSYSQSVALEGAKDWSFSAYVRIESALTGGDAYLRLTHTNGTQWESKIKLRDSTLDVSGGPGADGWERLHLIAENVPAGTVTAEMVCNASAGTVRFAAPQLEEGVVANRVNQLENADFRLTVNNTQNSTTVRQFPQGWSAGSGISTSTLNGVIQPADFPSGLGGKVLQMYSTPVRDSVSFNQIIYTNGLKGDVLTLGGWANTNSVASKGYVDFAVDFYKDGAWGNRKRFSFSREWVGWQFACFPVVAPVDYLRVRIYISYTYNANTAQFTNVFLYKESFGQSFAYDSKKNVTSTGTLAGQQSGKKYDDFDNLTEYRQPGAATDDKHLMTYGSTDAEKKQHLLKTSQTPMAVKSHYTYDDYGNQTVSTLGKTNDGVNPRMQTQTAYTANGNYTTSVTDARGKVATQSVDPIKGTLTWAKDPKQQQVDYTYDTSRHLTSTQAVADGKTYRNEYTYDKDRLKTVKHNTTTATPDVTYTFEYDALGAQTQVKVGNQPLSTNVYSSDRSHKLLRSEFGNGGKVVNEYDDFDRLMAIRYDAETTPRYEYEYGANGQASYVKDNHLQRVHQTEYDLAERPCQTTTRDAAGNLIYRATLVYDKMNRLTTFRQTAGGEKHETLYGYDKDNRPAPEKNSSGTVTKHAVQYGALADNRYVDYAYDDMGRVITRTQRNGSHTSAAAYTFAAGNPGVTNSTTPLVTGISQPGLALAYTYDDTGNILSEVKNGQTTTYVYDKLGQLIRVNDPHENATWLYSYDMGGNILSKSRYAYTTGTLGPVLETITYVYDATWKDKLISYNGKGITYDAIGNPLTYDGWAFTWKAGRQLASMVKTGTNASFKYDASGLRTQKTVNGVVTDYTLHGKLITHLKQGGTNLQFFYDVQSRPSMVKYNGAFYTYIHNLQGDILGIVDSTGTKVVEYKYDAWGKPLSGFPAGTLANTLGKLNPFRYRGYVWDEETSLYYLRSRYYNPEWGRFLNADSLLGKSGGFLTHNLSCYCVNNPVLCYDQDGRETITFMAEWGQQMAPVLSTAGNAAMSDGPMLVGDAIGAVILIGGALWTLGTTSVKVSTQETVISGANNDADVNEREEDKRDSKPTLIYRYGSYNATTFTPRPGEMNISCFLTPPPNAMQKYSVSTLEAVNASKVFKARIDNPVTGHVSITPNIPNKLALKGTMGAWALTRPTAKEAPSPLTISLMALFGRVK